jgi:hypothetical protein
MRYVPALILDAVFVLVFAVIGRASHQEDAGGFLITAWPFLVALLLGHAAAALLPARPRRPWSLLWGVVVWVVTVVGGILLRLVSGDTAQVAFVIVATLTLGLLLVGWRAVAALLRRRAARPAESDPAPVDPAPVDPAPVDPAPVASERVDDADADERRS